MKRIFLAAALLLLSIPSLAATCKISEYVVIVTDPEGRWVPVAEEPALTTQTVTYTTSTQSAAFNASPRTRFVRIVCDAKAHLVFGTNPTATANSPYVAADTPEYFGLALGGTWKVAFYDGSS